MALADYGIDAPKEQQSMMWRGATFVALGLGIFVMNRREYPGPAGAMLGVLGLVGLVFLGLAFAWYWTSKNGKLKLRDEIIAGLDLKGDEKVLDVGCGRGLLLIGLAKKLSGKGGKATGCDIWTDDLSGNSAEAALANAKAEGVADKCKIETSDATALPYAAGAFDAVVSALCIHNIPSPEGRAKAVSEIYRVTKPGGKIAIFDLFRVPEVASELQSLGAAEVTQSTLSYGPFPGKIVRAKKA
jgi:ubiquinone/menaquinone biosynthesis C-methylase UbiE